MPAVQPQQIVDAILGAIEESNFSATLVSSVRTHPRRFSILAPDGNRTTLSVYVWTLTFGGRPALPNEYRIQMTSVKSPLEIAEDGPTVLIGYEPDLNLFAGFDLKRHRTFTTGSPSVQVDRERLKEAETQGLSFHRKSNDEIAVGVRPDQFIAYAFNAQTLHRYGKDAKVLHLLQKATAAQRILETELNMLTPERRRIVQTISRLSRDARFKQSVLFAYGNRCAITRVQLRLVDAAHILPVGAPGSTDHVSNGLALSPTYHRAYDQGLIYLDAAFRMHINAERVTHLTSLGLEGGLKTFRAPLGKIFLPPYSNQWPAIELIRKANRYRRIQQ